jgi:hypothetical protein
MKDEAKGISSVVKFVHRVIAKSAWGKLMPTAESDENTVPHWIMAYDTLSWDKPQLNIGEDGENQEDIISYYDYLK